ncbi:MAG: hypothetical protein RBT68_00955 [Spirochaetia bacterium]|jgi:hypothetical protein|nr:hypothetical protein [Spirochaetia bacterium]
MDQIVYAVDDPTDLDTEKAAFEVFPLFVSTSNTVLRREYASALADIIGTPGEFHAYVRGNNGDLASRHKHLLGIFKDNVRLLVTKTWVDKHDEKRKSRTLDELDALSTAFLDGNYQEALNRFTSVADSVAILLFGETPSDNGFMDYVFRIDPRLGIFYWYVSNLREQPTLDPDLARLELLVGIYALSSF